MGDIVEGKDFDSYILKETTDIRDGCNRMLFAVKTWCKFEPAGVYDGWTSKDWASGEQDTFKNNFKKQINDGWGNGAIWLYHSDKTPPDVWCDVQIQYIDDRDKAHLVIQVLKEPSKADKSGFRPSCDFGGNTAGLFGENPIDMVMSLDAVTDRWYRTGTDSTGEHKFYQFVSQHEFGHYLNCHHYCEWAADDPNAGPAYCRTTEEGYMDHIMAIGNKWTATSTMDGHAGRGLDASNAGAPFAARLARHGYTSGAIKPYVAQGHTDDGGGNRTKRPWK